MKLSVCKPIDKLLDGGLEHSAITNLYGPPATGKTNIALQACVSCIKNGKKSLYIDTEGGFSLGRVEQLTNGQSINFMENLSLFQPATWDQQKDHIRRVEDILKNESYGLVVVDSIVALWRLETNDENAQETNKELATQMSLLAKLAREYEIPVLITNQVYSDIESGKIEVSSRSTVKWWSKNMIELMHAGRTGCRIARIARARNLPEDKQIEFEITNDGLKEVSKLRLF